MMKFPANCYAHSLPGRPDAEWQLLEKHLLAVAEMAKRFAEPFGFEYSAYLAGLLHDMGKSTAEFQEYLKKAARGERVKRGEVVHALQGAKYVAESVRNDVIADVLGNVIASHHGGLFDSIDDGARTLLVKTIRNSERLHYEEAAGYFSPEVDEAKIQVEFEVFLRKCQEHDLNCWFMLHLLTKSIYSCVIDADRCDSAGLVLDCRAPAWGVLLEHLENYLASFSINGPLDKIRWGISEQCGEKGRLGQGTYTLAVPTGGGKTLSSLRFALEHAKTHGLKRIVYVIPYLSILDQTATELRKVFNCLGEDLILEHHSNIDIPHDDDAEEQYRFLTSRWDSPIVLTTMVQFLETIYSNKASRLRKFHQMSEAVLVFDEVQALPIKCVHLFNEAVNFLQVFGRSTILLCTATQPHLHKTERPVRLDDGAEIVNITPEESDLFERVRIIDKTQDPMSHRRIAQLAEEQLQDGKSTLVILNTKSDAQKLYEECRVIECEKAFLTTDLCPTHRLDVLDRLKRSLKSRAGKVTLCVSTQLIEAGVDISFDCVIRALAGMDSIVQAAGRCNRNKEHSTPQSVFVVSVEDERLSWLPEIKNGRDITTRVFREERGGNLLNDTVIARFYEYYFYRQKDKMDFNTKDGKTTIHNLLNRNDLGTAAYRNANPTDYTGLPCAFQRAADEFHVIEGVQTGVVVPYGDALKIVDAFKNTSSTREKLRVLKQLQRYTVSLYSHSLDEIKDALCLVEDAFYLLSPDYYDSKEQGLRRQAMQALLNA